MGVLNDLTLEERQVAERSLSMLHAWESEIDEDTLERLRSLRERAIGRAGRSRFSLSGWAPGRRH